MTTLDRVVPGGVITWLVTVTNKAGNTAKNITLIYTLPFEATYQNCSVEGGDCGGIASNFVATLPELTVGESKVIVLSAKVKDGVLKDTIITGNAAVSCLLPDPDLTNNTSQSKVKIVESVLTAQANGKIIFTSDRAFSNSTEPSGLYTINPDGTGETFLSKLANHGSPRWSPDGTKLVVLTREEYIQDLVVYVTNPDGSGKVKIADNALPNLLSWSPDGKKFSMLGRWITVCFWPTRMDRDELNCQIVYGAGGRLQTRRHVRCRPWRVASARRGGWGHP